MESNLRILNAFKNLKESIEKEKEKTELNKKNIAIHDEEFEKVMKRVNDIIKQAQENKEELKNEITDKIENIKIRVPKDGKNGIDGKNGRDGVDGLDGQDGKDGRDGKDGKDGLNGKDGKDGKDGVDGVGILDAEINKEGELILKLTDGRKINVGRVTGRDGIGYRGLQGIGVTNAEIKQGHLIITLSNGQEIDAGHISGGGSGGTSDYEELDNLPSINNVELIGNKTLHDLGIQEEGDYALSSEIPTQLSELSDDSTHRLVTDTEKQTWNNKSDFSGNYNDLSNKPDIPSKTSDLTNDSGFITKDVNNLTNYTKTSELSNVATSGSYEDLSNKPTIPVVPTNVSAFTNDAGYLTQHQSLSGYATEQWVENQGYLTQHQDISGKEDKTNKVTSISSSSTDTEYPSAKSVYTTINNKFFYINVSSSNTTTTTWSELYEAYSNEKIIFAKIDYMQGITIVPVIEPLYLVVGNQSGGTFMFTFVMGNSSINYMVTGTGNNVCIITKQEKAFEETDNKVQSVTQNSTSTDYYPSTKAIFDEFQRKPVVVWESSTPSEYLKAIQTNLSASPAWQLTNLDLTPYKRIKIYSCAGQGTGTTASASTTPAIILEMSLDSRAAISAYGGNYVGSVVVQKPNDNNRLATLTCAVSADKTSFAVLRQTNLYGTAATSNNDVNANVFMIEGYYD